MKKEDRTVSRQQFVKEDRQGVKTHVQSLTPGAQEKREEGK
jgi:hypothetical protein